MSITLIPHTSLLMADQEQTCDSSKDEMVMSGRSITSPSTGRGEGSRKAAIEIEMNSQRGNYKDRKVPGETPLSPVGHLNITLYSHKNGKSSLHKIPVCLLFVTNTPINPQNPHN